MSLARRFGVGAIEKGALDGRTYDDHHDRHYRRR
jgi:hypothetical protein